MKARIPKRIGVLGMIAVTAIVGMAAVVAFADTNPADLGCTGEFFSVGSVLPGPDGVHSTPEKAAAAFATDLSAEGKQASTEAEIVDISSSPAVRGDVAISADRLYAAQVDGNTIAVLGVNEDEAGWAVETFISC